MARNKYPQVTVERILDVSQQLFFEKGCENTTIQDIVTALGDLSKGAIYHHFKSKDEIIVAVINRLYSNMLEVSSSIQHDKALTGLEKLRGLLHASLDNPTHGVVFEAMPNLMQNPKIFVMHFECTLHELAHTILLPLIRQGMQDGSIETDSPKELAEVVALLANIWLNPLICRGSAEDLEQKCRFFQTLTKSLGADLVDDTFTEKIQRLRSMADPHP